MPQDVLRRLYAIDGVSGTQATVSLETFFERPPSPASVPASAPSPASASAKASRRTPGEPAGESLSSP